MKRLISWLAIKILKQQHCPCMAPPVTADNFKPYISWYDEAHYGYAEVLICKKCASHWLKYTLEFEGYAGSGRWYRGLLNPLKSRQSQISDPTKYLSELPWYIHGGLYFNHNGERSSGLLNLRP
jgi:hypothetical protein